MARKTWHRNNLKAMYTFLMKTRIRPKLKDVIEGLNKWKVDHVH